MGSVVVVDVDKGVELGLQFGDGRGGRTEPPIGRCGSALLMVFALSSTQVTPHVGEVKGAGTRRGAAMRFV